MTDCISHLLSRSAKLELLMLIGKPTMDDVMKFTYVPTRRRYVTTGGNPEWKYLKALAKGHFDCFRFGPEPLKGVSEEAFQLARDNAKLDKFVADMFKGGEELYIPGVIPSSELISTIIKAFKVHSPALASFRPLSLRLSQTYLDHRLDLYAYWQDAAERRIRTCPFCSPVFDENSANFPVPRVTDRYHILNAGSGQQLTIELSYRCCRPEDACGEPEEFWERITGSICFLRIAVDDDVRCHPELPQGPHRQLALPRQEDLLLEVFGFASRDDLDASQLACKLWRQFVNNAAGTLALRPLQHVIIDLNCVFIERTPVSKSMPGDAFDALWEHLSVYRLEDFRPQDVPIVMSLLRHGCAQCYASYDDPIALFCPITQHLADGGRTFRAKSVMMRCESLQGITCSLDLMAEIGAKDFRLRVRFIGAAPVIFGNDVLLSAERFHLGYDDGSEMTASELRDIQEHCHQYMTKAVGCHVSFRPSHVLFSCDDIIERFLAAARSDDFAMPLSIQMMFDSTSPGIPKPANCRHATLRDVAIPRKVLTCFRGRAIKVLKFDVYHFRNERTNEWLTVCLSKDRGGTIDYVILQKGRTMASLEDIGK